MHLIDHTYFNILNIYFHINYIKEAYKNKKFLKYIHKLYKLYINMIYSNKLFNN